MIIVRNMVHVQQEDLIDTVLLIEDLIFGHVSKGLARSLPP